MRISDWSSDVCSSDLQDHPESGCGGGQEVYLLIGERSVLRVEKAPLAAFGVEDVLFIPPDGEVRTAGAQFGDQRQRLRIVMLTGKLGAAFRSEEHTSELQSLMRISYAVFCLKKKKKNQNRN